jgi:hypothetical protein
LRIRRGNPCHVGPNGQLKYRWAFQDKKARHPRPARSRPGVPGVCQWGKELGEWCKPGGHSPQQCSGPMALS